MKASDRYIKVVEWSPKDRCYVGSCPGLMLGGVHGETELAVFRELCQVIDEWVAIQEADGEPMPPTTAGKDFSGKFLLRVGKDLHKTLALDALRSGESLNEHCVKLLREGRPGYRPGHQARWTQSTQRD